MAMARPMRSSQAVPADWLHQRLGLRLIGQSAVGGGCIHSGWCLQLEGDGGPRLFAKTSPRSSLPLLEAEAEGLAALAIAAEGSGLQVPQPLALGVAGDRALLVLPWLECRPAAGGDWERLGQGLARMHRASLERACAPGDRSDAHGWWRDNWIGSGPQPNGWCEAWSRFFAERRLAPQAERLAQRGERLPGMEELLQRLPQLLHGHQPPPCLVHGDLWSGNVMAGLRAAPKADSQGLGSESQQAEAGAGALFDPAVHRGDREVDLAMARLFGGFPSAFFAGYDTVWPLPKDHGSRVDLYNLYHLLNHANLFGGGYCEQARQAIARCLA